MCLGLPWVIKAMYKVVKKFTVSTNNLVQSVVFLIIGSICLIVLEQRRKVSLSQGQASQHEPGSLHLSCNRGRLPSKHQCHSNFTELTLARMYKFPKKRMLCLYNRYVVSLLKAVRQHHCFGLIHMLTCIIIVSVYIIWF